MGPTRPPITALTASLGAAPEPLQCPQESLLSRGFYRRRHKIENFFCRIKDWRRIATRYDKLARNFLAATTLVGVLYWINCESRP